MAMEFIDGRWQLQCKGCKSLNPQAWYQNGDFECCNSCGRVVDTTPRDAIGQKVRVPTDRIGTYSYAIGERIQSSSHYADILKKEGLGITNGRESEGERRKYG